MLLLHILSAILGIISSTLRSILLLKKGALDSRLQKITWILLLVLGSTGVSLAFAKPDLFHDPKFLMKMFFVGALSFSEFYLAFRKSRPAIFISIFTWFFSFMWSGLQKLSVGYLGVILLYSATAAFFLLAPKILQKLAKAS